MPDLDEMTPSIGLLQAILAAEAAGLDTETQLSVIAGYERLLSWLSACQTRHLADAYQHHETDPDTQPQWFAERVGIALGVAGGSAFHRMRQAVVMVEKMPQLTRALTLGSVTTHHVRLAATRVRVLDVETAHAVDAAVTANDDWRTPSQLDRALAKTILELDPAGAAARHAARRRERNVCCRNEPDGMVGVYALLPAEHGQALVKRVDAHARSSCATRAPGDDRTLAERRADALIELCLRDGSANPAGTSTDATSTEATASTPTPAGDGPRMHGRRPEICVTVSMSTLMGSDHAPAHLEGYGWIDADTARRIAADPNSVWRRLIVDPPSGRLLDYGRTTYRPPQDLQDHVIARDRHCLFPTCDRPAITCDIDHRDDWIDGGHTRVDTNHALCRRHHTLRHQAGWTYTIDPDDDSSIWTDPHGTRFTKPAATLPTPEPVEPPPPPDLGDPPF